jgi:hypothetical protein
MTFLPEDEGRLRLVLGFGFGFAVLLFNFILALAIGLGKVHKDTSYGLELVLGSLGTISGAFATWAFGMMQKKD